MLLAFSIVNDLFDSGVKGTVMAVVNMTIGICAFIFQYIVGFVGQWINGGDLKTISHQYVFTLSFLVLLIPLVVSAVLLYFVEENK